MKTPSAILLILVTAVITAYPASYPDHARVRGPEFRTGLEEVRLPAGYVPPRTLGRATLDEGTPGSTYDTVGVTWYDNQHNGTAGKMHAVDAIDMLHFVWTNGLNSGSSSRHVYYNVYDPAMAEMAHGTGVQVDASSRAGYATVAVNQGGFAFPAFHMVPQAGGNAHAAVAFDFLPGAGAFTAVEIPYVGDEDEVIWPKIDIGIDGNLQLLCTENGGEGLEYHAIGTPLYDEFGYGAGIDWNEGFVQWDTTAFITLDVATSRHSDRVAVIWIRDVPGEHDAENVFMRISEDGGQNWGELINVTDIPPIDTMCVDLGGDPMICNADTMRPWIDCSVLLDDDDNVHVAFTAHGWYYWDEEGVVGPYGFIFANIWHWDEVYNEFNIIAEAWYAHQSVAMGINNLACHRPSLSIDTTTGYLYCSYQQFDSVQVSQAGYPSGDAWISVSTNNGRAWSQGVNVTGTDTGVDTPAGECRSERDIFLPKFVTDGTLHLYYQMDHDCGTSELDSPEGVPTLNEMIYQRIPVEDIPTRPLINPFRAFRADSTGYPWGLDTTVSISRHPESLPAEFTLYQNYPNPFNPETRIQIDLSNTVPVSLRIFDVTGREVTRVVDHEPMPAGAHVLSFDGSALPSGVYFYRLETPLGTSTRKMVLIK